MVATSKSKSSIFYVLVHRAQDRSWTESLAKYICGFIHTSSKQNVNLVWCRLFVMCWSWTTWLCPEWQMFTFRVNVTSIQYICWSNLDLRNKFLSCSQTTGRYRKFSDKEIDYRVTLWKLSLHHSFTNYQNNLTI